MSSVAKSAICGLYKYTGAMHVQERCAYWSGKRFMTAVLFHRVTNEIPLDGLTVSTAWFQGFCALMRDRFHVVPLAELWRVLQAGETPPPRTLAITFDDCYRDNLFAARVLADHGLPATFFVPTKFVGTDHVFHWDAGLKQMANLTWDDIKEMQSLGHSFGSHSVSHPDMGTIDADAARIEFADSKRTLEDCLGQAIRFFAAPYGGRGNFRPEYLPLAHELGYDACFSAVTGFIQPNLRGQVLPRVAMPYFRSLLNLEVYLTGCLDWFADVKRRVGVFSALGSVSLAPSLMAVNDQV
jgi:peptidoglycan/xylan/chitin deacetylase (PgdA/CDA1 family)